MIRQVIGELKLNESCLSYDHFGRKIRSLFIAYGTGFEFCRFFEIYESETKGYICIFNAGMVISTSSEINVESLAPFILMTKPFKIEGKNAILLKLKDCLKGEYKSYERTLFEYLNNQCSEEIQVNEYPKLDIVYDIIDESFPNSFDYPLWLTDASHKIRHHISKIYLYNNCTTLTIEYDMDNYVLISQVATKISQRGKGFAGRLLCYTCDRLLCIGRKPVLYAKDNRISFYKSIGFKEIERNIVLERIEN